MSRPILRRAALAIVLVTAMFAGWYAWELHRPESASGPDLAAYQQETKGSRQVLLPLTVEIAPITKLALLPFDGHVDEIYSGLEPQFLDRGHEKGFRIMAYRHDGYVDMYDDTTLTFDPDERSDVTGKGLHQHVSTDLHQPVLERDSRGRAHIAFAFTDIHGRAVRAEIREGTARRSVPTNLQAPIGLSSTQPAYYPLFVLHGFEFLRTANLAYDVTIDGRPMPAEPFPVPIPLQGQLRNFGKYSLDTELLAVFPTHDRRVRTVTLTGDVFQDHGVTYLFEGPALARIRTDRTEIVFTPALDVSTTGTGRYDMTAYPDRGVVGGEYRVETTGAQARLTMNVTRVTVPHQRDPVYRLIVNEKSSFGTWPKAYRYEATIDHAAGTIDARWVNERPGG